MIKLEMSDKVTPKGEQILVIQTKDKTATIVVPDENNDIKALKSLRYTMNLVIMSLIERLERE
jgi:hypothetical protein